MYLAIHNISKAYKGKPAVKNISFTVQKGSMLCLLGPSGCGKTTILKTIGGFITPDSGSVFLDGTDITDKPPEERTVSTVFQSYGLFPHMNVLENIIYGLKFKAIPKKERIAMGLEMLRTMGLSGYEKKHTGELSGGEQQRVALARSLIIKPKLLLLDEPLSNLDAKLRISMRKEIKRIQKDFRITTVFVTHDQSEAFELADTIILMDKGIIMQEGTAQELYNTPRNDFVRDFIGSSNTVDGGYIRPERVSILSTEDKKRPDGRAADKTNTMNGSDCEPSEPEQAEITDIIFKGEIIELQLRLKDKTLKSVVLNDGAAYRRGDVVYVRYQSFPVL